MISIRHRVTFASGKEFVLYGPNVARHPALPRLRAKHGAVARVRLAGCYDPRTNTVTFGGDERVAMVDGRAAPGA